MQHSPHNDTPERQMNETCKFCGAPPVNPHTYECGSFWTFRDFGLPDPSTAEWTQSERCEIAALRSQLAERGKEVERLREALREKLAEKLSEDNRVINDLKSLLT